MTSKQSSNSPQRTSKQNQYFFNIDKERQIEISSNFESGNIALVKQIHQLYYILESVSDSEGGQGRKSWFYFRMRSVRGIKVRLIVQNVSIYETIFQEKYHCKPMIKDGNHAHWKQLNESFFTFRDEIALVIDHTFKNAEDVYICLSVPFSYSENEQYLQKIKMNIHPCIDYIDEVLAVTPQKRNVHLLSVTERARTAKKAEEKKPVIMVTSRVHPGQVSSSYCFQGILQFLLNYNNMQAYLLRRLFIFKMVPMLNPDGVCQGNYRMDPQGFNLNRFYNEPSPDSHPAIFQVAQLMRSLAVNSNIEFYFDLHSHSCIKESFIYGNALDDLVSQTYSELYCRILEQNYPRFRTYLSNFGEKQMKHKDKGELLSKQGCGRVVINKLYGVLQSYTVESSVFPAAYDCFISKTVKGEQKNKDFRHESAQRKEIYNFQSVYQLAHPHQNVIVSENKLLGRSILVSILDMIKKNPYTRLADDYNQSCCKELSLKLFQNQERFKLLDIKAYQKCKLISQLIKNSIEDRLDRQWQNSGVSQEINAIKWPRQFRNITVSDDPLMKDTKSMNKSVRVKTQGREIASRSLSKPKQHPKLKTQMRYNNVQWHGSISPKDIEQCPIFFPQIKYSMELKSEKGKESVDLKVAAVKEMQLNVTQGSNLVFEGDKVKKRMILDYIHEEMGKINPDKQIFKRSNASLNRLIANKIIEKERAKNRNSQLNQYQRIILQSRKRIATEAKEGLDQALEVKIIKERLVQGNDDELKGLQLKKAQMVKKRFVATNKAIQLVKRNDKVKVKLPDLNKLNLLVQNSKKQRERPVFLDQTYLRATRKVTPTNEPLSASHQ